MFDSKIDAAVDKKIDGVSKELQQLFLNHVEGQETSSKKIVGEKLTDQNARQIESLDEVLEQKLANQNVHQMARLGEIVEQKLADQNVHQMASLREMLDKKMTDQNTRQMARLDGMVEKKLADQNIHQLAVLCEMLEKKLETHYARQIISQGEVVEQKLEEQSARQMESWNEMVEQKLEDQNSRQITTQRETVDQKLADQNAHQMARLKEMMDRKLWDQNAQQMVSVREMLDKKLEDQNASQMKSLTELVDQKLVHQNVYQMASLREMLDKKVADQLIRHLASLSELVDQKLADRNIHQMASLREILDKKLADQSTRQMESINEAVEQKFLEQKAEERILFGSWVEDDTDKPKGKGFLFVWSGNGDIDWSELLTHNPDLWDSSAPDFSAAARAGWGASGEDEKFEEYFIGMKAAKIGQRGALHGFIGTDTAEKQFENFTNHVTRVGFVRGQDVAIVSLWEFTDSTTVGKYEQASRFVELINKIDKWNGKKTTIKTGSTYWEKCAYHLSEEEKVLMGKHPLWVFYCTPGKTSPVLPDPWTDWSMWQYTREGDVNGITKGARLSRVKTFD